MTRIAFYWTLAVACALLGAWPARALDLLDPASLEKYVDPLPDPWSNVITPSGTMDGVPLYDVSISQFQQQLHRDLPPTTVWGYNGTFPGPTFDVDRGDEFKVRWTNNLVDGTGAELDHLLPYDTTVHGAGPQFPEARVVTHIHGGLNSEADDGFPEHWFSPDPDAPANGLGGPAGNSLTTYHNNPQRAATLWYHDHAMGITRLNVYAGLAGFYLLRDAQEQALNLPSGKYEVPLVLQDRMFYDDGELFYPAGPGDLSSPGEGDPLQGLPDEFPSEASVVSHFIGDTNLVNGVIWPYMEVEPRKYRLRLLNGANKRTYSLLLDDGEDGAPDFYQIGTDGGLLPAPVVRDEVFLAPADRVDVIVDFSQYEPGDEILLRNTGPDDVLRINNTPADPNTTGQVMQFRVVPSTGPDTSSLPQTLPPIERYLEEDAVATRTLELDRITDSHGRTEFLLNGNKWTDEPSEVVRLGDLEVWELVNRTGVAHPIHLHSDHFQILERIDRFGDPIPLEPHELGWEDTVNVNGLETVRILVKFTSHTGTFVWHCHCLEHEDHEMMRPLVITPPLSGDYNHDGNVDAADYTVWRDMLGQEVAEWTGADGNGDGTITQADYQVWKDNFGNTTSGAAAASHSHSSHSRPAVPEPTAIVLIAMAVAFLPLQRR